MFEIPKAYEPGKIEQKWYDFWFKQGYFTPKIDPNKKPFVIIMPPPNVTGELHLGHALTATLEDIMVRWHRMKGEPTLWLPGTDHAGIATQVVVEQQLAKQNGLTRARRISDVSISYWEHPAIGPGRNSPWMKVRAKQYGPLLSVCTIRG